MEQHQYIALLLFAVALADLPLGFIVARRQQRAPKGLLILAFMVSSLILTGLGVAFWLKLIG